MCTRTCPCPILLNRQVMELKSLYICRPWIVLRSTSECWNRTFTLFFYELCHKSPLPYTLSSSLSKDSTYFHEHGKIATRRNHWQEAFHHTIPRHKHEGYVPPPLSSGQRPRFAIQHSPPCIPSGQSTLARCCTMSRISSRAHFPAGNYSSIWLAPLALARFSSKINQNGTSVASSTAWTTLMLTLTLTLTLSWFWSCLFSATFPK